MHWLLLTYPLLVHAAIVSESDSLALCAMVLIAVNLTLPLARRRPVWGFPALILAVTGALAFALLGKKLTFLYAAPVLIPLALAGFFAFSLFTGGKPIITRIAEGLRGPLPAPVARYTRRLTFLWAGFLVALALANLAFAIWAPAALWSLFSNFINYALVGVLFVAEWCFRLFYLRHMETLTWRQYLSGLARLDYRALIAAK